MLPGDYNARVRNETEFDSEEKEMLKELLLLHPKDFAITAGDKVAMKLVDFSLIDIDCLPTPAVPSIKQRRTQFVRTVLDQTPVTDSVRVQRLVSIEGLPVFAGSAGTATKLASDLWLLIVKNGNGETMQLNLSTSDLAEDQGYNVLAESISLEATEKQKRQQRESENRLRKVDEKRREVEAVQLAKQKRDIMLRKEYENLVSICSSPRAYEFTEFLELDKMLNDPFQITVLVEGKEMLAFANKNTAGSLNLTMSKLLTGELFSLKRLQTAEDGHAPKRQKIGRYVPTIASEDGVSAIECLERYDNRAALESTKKERKSVLREKLAVNKFLTELQRFQDTKGMSFYDVRGSNVKAHVTFIYRLFEGTSYSKQTIQTMKAYLHPIRVDSQTAQCKILSLKAKQTELSGKYDTLTVSLIGHEDDDTEDPPAAVDESLQTESVTRIHPSRTEVADHPEGLIRTVATLAVASEIATTRTLSRPVDCEMAYCSIAATTLTHQGDGNNRPRGRCCADFYCIKETLQLSKVHLCFDCRGMVHVLCGECVVGSDDIRCNACLNKKIEATVAGR